MFNRFKFTAEPVSEEEVEEEDAIEEQDDQSCAVRVSDTNIPVKGICFL